MFIFVEHIWEVKVVLISPFIVVFRLAFAKRPNPRKIGLFSCIKQNISSMVYGKIELSETINQSTKKEMYTYDNT